MKIDYIVNPEKNTKELVLIAENDAEGYQLRSISNLMGNEYRYGLYEHLKFEIK